MKAKFLSAALSLIMASSMIASPQNSVVYADEYQPASVTKASATANAKNGWYSNNKGNKFYYENGTKVTAKTKLIDGKIYLFDENGALLVDGIHEVKGYKYCSDKDGRVRCNQWVASKTSSYAAATGRITEYSFKKASEKDKTICLYVNGKLATDKSLPLNGVIDIKKYIDTSEYDEEFINLLGTVESRCGFFKVGSHYYHLNYNSSKKRVECDFSGKVVNASTNCNNSLFYDLGSGKLLGYALGYVLFNDKGYISDGILINSIESATYAFNKEKVTITKVNRNSVPIAIVDVDSEQNSVGGLDYTLGIVNNSGKTINYIYYTVHVINRVGDNVKCTITRDSTFLLKDTGPYKAGETTKGTWEAFMYNYSADKVVIDKVEIKYNDGTSVTIDGSNVLYLDLSYYA